MTPARSRLSPVRLSVSRTVNALGATTSESGAPAQEIELWMQLAEGRGQQAAPGEAGIGRSRVDTGSACRGPRAKLPSLEPSAARLSAVPPAANLKAADPQALRHRLTPAMPLSRSICGVVYRQFRDSVQGAQCDSPATGPGGGVERSCRGRRQDGHASTHRTLKPPLPQIVATR